MVGVGYHQRLILIRTAVLSQPAVREPSPTVRGLWPTTIPSRSLNFVLINNPWPPQGRCGSGENASGPFGGDFEMQGTWLQIA